MLVPSLEDVPVIRPLMAMAYSNGIAPRPPKVFIFSCCSFSRLQLLLSEGQHNELDRFPVPSDA